MILLAPIGIILSISGAALLVASVRRALADARRRRADDDWQCFCKARERAARKAWK